MYIMTSFPPSWRLLPTLWQPREVRRILWMKRNWLARINNYIPLITISLLRLALSLALSLLSFPKLIISLPFLCWRCPVGTLSSFEISSHSSSPITGLSFILSPPWSSGAFSLFSSWGSGHHLPPHPLLLQHLPHCKLWFSVHLCTILHKSQMCYFFSPHLCHKMHDCTSTMQSICRQIPLILCLTIFFISYCLND